MDTSTIVGIAGIIVTLIIGFAVVSNRNSKVQKNKISITAKNNSTIDSKNIIAGDSNSDMRNED
jgi:hypothetical protein